MTYPANTLTATRALLDLDRFCDAAKRTCTAFRDSSAREPMPIDRLLAFEDQITRLVADIDRVIAVPDLIVAGRKEKRDPTLDVVTEATAVRDALTALSAWLKANTPAPRVASAELQGMRDLADVVIAAVD